MDRDGIAKDASGLARSWPDSGPPELWSIDVGEGYAGPVIQSGRIYLMDYDVSKRQDAIRCLSLADGKEIWRYSYPSNIKRNHGMSRTVPAVIDNYVVTIGPKCNVACLDALTGEVRWGIDLVREYGATVPPWYAGQCPFIDKDKVILAPGGKDALLIAVDLKTGKLLWKSPNPNGWLMTHSSVMPMQFNGRPTYVYCAGKGVVGVSADTGALLWETPDWKISFANVPSPLVLENGRIFFSGGYGAGSLMIQLQQQDQRIAVSNIFKLEPNTFGATQHTPVRYKDHLYGVRPDGQLVCLSLDGKPLWTSTPKNQYGLGPFFIAGDLIYALSEKGMLSLVEATPEKFNLLAQAQVLKGHEAWGPMALAGTRLLARDLTRMVCLDVGAK